MIKHLGMHNNKKVVVLFRKVPGEDHMCLVVYPELLPRHLETELMSALRSPIGQQSNNFSEVVFNHQLPNNESLLAVMHREGFIKKINANQTVITPVENSTQGSVRLDELNKIIDDLEAGNDAAAKLEGMDKNSGLTAKALAKNETRTTSSDIMESGSVRPNASADLMANPSTANIGTNVLSDADLAKSNMDQATQMRRQAEALIAEAKRLETEAKSFTKVTKSNASKKAKATQS